MIDQAHSDYQKYYQKENNNFEKWKKHKVNQNLNDDYFDSSDENSTEKVSPSSDVDPAYITLVTTYKVTQTFDDEDSDINYTYEGYQDYTLEDNRLVKSSATDKVGNSVSKDKLSELNDELQSEEYSKIQ
ncbi:Uncharacterised protein [Staphylococcus cohnii subsp. cohnii]|nr:Uncharacterised protein [Staphylococcus cohnii subsp. cohnii]